jgi:hypothetical protein
MAMNPYTLNPPRVPSGSNTDPSGTMSVMPVSDSPVAQGVTSSYSILQNQQSLQDQMQNQQSANQQAALGNPQFQQASGNTAGIIANQMRSRSAAAAPSVQTARMGEAADMAPGRLNVASQKSGLQMQPQRGLQPGQASANASPKMNVY